MPLRTLRRSLWNRATSRLQTFLKTIRLFLPNHHRWMVVVEPRRHGQYQHSYPVRENPSFVTPSTQGLFLLFLVSLCCLNHVMRSAHILRGPKNHQSARGGLGYVKVAKKATCQLMGQAAHLKEWIPHSSATLQRSSARANQGVSTKKNRLRILCICRDVLRSWRVPAHPCISFFWIANLTDLREFRRFQKLHTIASFIIASLTDLGETIRFQKWHTIPAVSETFSCLQTLLLQRFIVNPRICHQFGKLLWFRDVTCRMSCSADEWSFLLTVLVIWTKYTPSWRTWASPTCTRCGMRWSTVCVAWIMQSVLCTLRR